MFARLLRAGIKNGRIALIDHQGQRHEFGSGEPSVTLRMHNPALKWQLGLNPWLKVGEAYMDGTLTIEDGTLYDFLDIAMRNTNALLGAKTQKMLDVVNVDARNKLHAFQYDPIERPRHLAWLDGLMKNNVVVINGQGPILQKVASGEYPIACGINYHSAQRLIDTGVKTLQFSVADAIPLEIGTRIYINKWSTMPATTQLFAVWLATAGQEVLDKTAYRGFPSNPLNRNYEAAKGKHTAICGSECVDQWDRFNQEYQTKLNIPALTAE